MKNMAKNHKNLSTTKCKDTSNRAKLLVSKDGIDRKRTLYKYGEKS